MTTIILPSILQHLFGVIATMFCVTSVSVLSKKETLLGDLLLLLMIIFFPEMPLHKAQSCSNTWPQHITLQASDFVCSPPVK